MKLAIRFGFIFLFILQILSLKAQIGSQQNCLPYNNDRVSAFTKSNSTGGGLVKFYNNINEDVTVKIISPGGVESNPRASIKIAKGANVEFRVGSEGNSAPLAVSNTSGIFIVFENGEKSCIYLVGEKGVKQIEDKRFFMFKASDFPKIGESENDPNGIPLRESNLPPFQGNPTSSSVSKRIYPFHKGNIINFKYYFNNDELSLFEKTLNSAVLAIDNGKLMMTVPEHFSSRVFLKSGNFNFRNNNFFSSLEIQGLGGLYFGNVRIGFNSTNGNFAIETYLKVEKKFNTIISGNLKNYNTTIKRAFSNPPEYIKVPAFPCENIPSSICGGFYSIAIRKEKDISNVYINDIQIFEGVLPFLDTLSNLYLFGNSGITKFDNFIFSDDYHKGIRSIGEYEPHPFIASCPNDKLAVIDANDNFLTDCLYDEIEDFIGAYARVLIKDDKIYARNYLVIDTFGNYVSGRYSFSVTDPNFENHKPEVFNCRANLKNGKLDGQFTCHFSNGKKYAEMSFANGKLKKNSFFMYDKKGNATHNETLDGVETREQFEGMQEELMMYFIDLLLEGIHPDTRNNVEMPGKPEDPDAKNWGG